MINYVKWSWKESVGYKKIKLGEIILKGAHWVHNTKIRSYGLEWSQLGSTMIKLGQMVLKGVNWIHNDKFGSNGLQRSQ